MKKLSIVLALILVVGCFAFAACSDSGDASSAAESSKTESTASEATSEATSEAASDVTSEEASDVTSEEAVSDTSVEGSEGKTGENVALNKTYTGAEPSSAGSYTAQLTDGVAGDATSYDNTWFAFYYNPQAQDQSMINVKDGVGTIIIDLGESYSNIAKVRVHVWSANASGIIAAKSITASCSNSGDGYTSLGDVVIPEGDAPAWAELTVSGATGRYIKIEVTVGGVWTFLNEVEVVLG